MNIYLHMYSELSLLLQGYKIFYCSYVFLVLDFCAKMTLTLE